jgi:hypothetical protein
LTSFTVAVLPTRFDTSTFSLPLVICISKKNGRPSSSVPWMPSKTSTKPGSGLKSTLT